MTDTTRPDGVEAIMELAESYCEKRHTLGAPEYNIVTARARDTLRAATIAALTAPASKPSSHGCHWKDRPHGSECVHAKPAGVTEAFERLVQEYTGRDMAYHQRNKTTGLDFARRAFEAGVSFAKPAEGGVVDALHDCVVGDSNYAAGMLLGWNLCMDGREDEFRRIRGDRLRAAASICKETRAALAREGGAK